MGLWRGVLASVSCVSLAADGGGGNNDDDVVSAVHGIPIVY